jgi:hypothetical protein
LVARGVPVVRTLHDITFLLAGVGLAILRPS